MSHHRIARTSCVEEVCVEIPDIVPVKRSVATKVPGMPWSRRMVSHSTTRRMPNGETIVGSTSHNHSNKARREDRIDYQRALICEESITLLLYVIITCNQRKIKQ